MNATTENMLNQFIAPIFHKLPHGTAREIAELTADETSQKRVQFLAERANEGELTDEERLEFQSLVDAGDLFAALQAIARQSLKAPQK
jgi:hypothetical protein